MAEGERDWTARSYQDGSMWQVRGTSHVNFGGGLYFSDPDDARLIAAAPELYEMTKLLEQLVEYEIRRDAARDDDEGARLKTATLNRVRAALAKAEGRE